jgi:glycosyltransferase involved in cell wall biosynthesis
MENRPQSSTPGPVRQLVLAVPVFKAERFLTATLASLNAQGARLRWYLQDGASPDRTAAIAREMARPGDTVVSEPDRGQTDAINRAMARMGGDIIGFINGDDLLAENAAGRVLDFFDEHPEIDLAYGSVDWIDEHGALIGTHTGRIESLAEVLDIYGVWWSGRQWVQPEVFFRRSLWEKVGPFNTAYHLAFDYDFWVRCFRADARVAHLPATLTRFRLHAAQKSTAAGYAADEIRTILQAHLAERPPLSPFRRWKIQAQLDYDLFQSGKSGAGGGFFFNLLRHPQWLLSPHARRRVQAACTRRFLSGR